MTDTDVELLWRPDPTRDNGMTAFRSWLAERGHDFPGYESLWEWSVSDLEVFWGAIASYFDVRFHSDFERGFIRGETVAYQDFIGAGGWKGAREQGLARAEGKEYVVQDGDVMLFRFSS